MDQRENEFLAEMDRTANIAEKLAQVLTFNTFFHIATTIVFLVVIILMVIFSNGPLSLQMFR